MALAAAGIIEVASTGSDGNPGVDTNAGAFNPANANFITNLAATSATGTAPVITSATYNFVAGDVSHWVFIKSGTNWTPGWYKISSVAANAATIDGTIGAAVLYATGGPYSVSTAAGCATVASPTSGTGGVDYSMCGTPKVSVTDAVTAGTTTITSATAPFANIQAGNHVYVQGGTGSIVAAIYEVVSVTNSTTIIVDRSTGLSVGTGATLKLGGCLLTPGQAGANAVAGNSCFIKAATYTILSASTNVATGCVNWPANSGGGNASVIQGYNSKRRDLGTKPLLQASGISTFTLLAYSTSTAVINISVDGALLTSSRGFHTGNISPNAQAVMCKAANCTNCGFNVPLAMLCESTGCSTVVSFGGNVCILCVAHDNTISGFGWTGTFGGVQNYTGCISANNTGASTDGFNGVAVMESTNCNAYANGRDGFRIATANQNGFAVNCIAYGNIGTGFNSAGLSLSPLMACAAGNNGTNFSTTLLQDALKFGLIVLTADPFTNAAGNDYSLNTTAGGGALLRALGIIGAFPGISTTTYQDVGAVQHADPAGGGMMVPSGIFGAESVGIGA